MATVIDFKRVAEQRKFERDLAAVQAKKLQRVARSKSTQRAQRAMAVRVAAMVSL